MPLIRLYECHECGGESTEKEWNESTAKHYGENVDEIMGIKEGKGYEGREYDCHYCCPMCGTDQHHAEIELVMVERAKFVRVNMNI